MRFWPKSDELQRRYEITASAAMIRAVAALAALTFGFSH